MADSAEAPAAQPTSSGKKKSSKPKKPKSSPSHPKVSEMVNSAITSLKERGGSSLQAIKKHIASSYKVDVEKLSPFIKKYLKNAVASGALIQTKGKGATGSFRLSASASGKPKEAPVKAKKAPSAPKKAKAAPARKPAAKPKAAKKPAAAAKKAKPKAAKSPKKAKATKPKTPKPKKAKAPAKKAAAKKGKK